MPLQVSDGKDETPRRGVRTTETLLFPGLSEGL